MVRFINENGIKRQATAEEETAFDAQAEKAKTDKANKKIAEEETANNRTSGKAKLKTGEALTDAEVEALFG
jgi:hypothetical protein